MMTDEKNLSKIQQLRETAAKAVVSKVDAAAKRAAKAGETTFVMGLSELGIGESKDERKHKVKELIPILKKEGYEVKELWTHPDCSAVEYCGEGCKPIQLEISF